MVAPAGGSVTTATPGATEVVVRPVEERDSTEMSTPDYERALSYVRLNEQAEKDGLPPVISRQTILETMGIDDFAEEMVRIWNEKVVRDLQQEASSNPLDQWSKTLEMTTPKMRGGDTIRLTHMIGSERTTSQWVEGDRERADREVTWADRMSMIGADDTKYTQAMADTVDPTPLDVPKTPNTPQPAPEPNDHPHIVDLVVSDLVERKAMGMEKYKTPLQPFNGRKPLVDAYQELLDQCVYLRQRLYEDDHTPEFVPEMKPIGARAAWSEKWYIDPQRKQIRPFYLHRAEDESGVSGTGAVAVGVRFPTGRCVVEWLVEPWTMGWYEKGEDVTAVHGHHGKTVVVWLGSGNIDVDGLLEELGTPHRGSEFTDVELDEAILHTPT